MSPVVVQHSCLASFQHGGDRTGFRGEELLQPVRIGLQGLIQLFSVAHFHGSIAIKLDTDVGEPAEIPRTGRTVRQDAELPQIHGQVYALRAYPATDPRRSFSASRKVRSRMLLFRLLNAETNSSTLASGPLPGRRVTSMVTVAIRCLEQGENSGR